MRRGLFVSSAGGLFALLQTGYFFHLELWLTAAYQGVFAVTLAWLLGSAAGLRWGRWLSGPSWAMVSLSAYFLTLWLLTHWPYQMTLLPLYGSLIAVSGAQAGAFFSANRDLYPHVGRLFFIENNGFMAGWVVGFLGFGAWGPTFHWIAPVLVVSLYGITGLLRSGVAVRVAPSGPPRAL